MPKTSWNALCLGQMYLAKGDLENAVKAFNIDQKHAFYPWIKVLTFSKGIKKDPRFLKLIREMNLPDPAPLVYNPDIN